MNKVALSLLVVAASGAYVWDQSRQNTAPDPLGMMLSAQEVAPATGSELTTATTPPTGADTAAGVETCAFVPSATPTQSQPEPLLRPALPADAAVITNAAMTAPANATFVDGTYAGPTADAYYGPIQIEAVVRGGQLTGIKVLQYPSDRRTSIDINRQALPMLRDEAVAAQSARIDIVTGATLTSEAFIRSLGGALAKARP